MSRAIEHNSIRQDRETERREREVNRLLITSCPTGEMPGGQDHDPPMIAALLKQYRLTALQIFSSRRQSRLGTVYLGKVKKILKNLNACFVEITDREQCFLHMDELEKAPPFLTGRTYDGRLLEGDELPVQLDREAVKTKQAAVTTHITLQGKYFVFAVGAVRTGISKKLDASLRSQITEFLRHAGITDIDGHPVQEEGVPPFGLVVRTQAGQAMEQGEEDKLLGEYAELRQRFTAVFSQGRHRTCYSCLYEAGTALEEALISFLPDEYQEIVTDIPQIYEELQSLFSDRIFTGTKRLRLYQDDALSLDKLYGLEGRLQEALGKTVWLRSGANLVIEQTESLTAVDVNTGKCVKLSGEQTPEETMRRVNLEAAVEVARQLRLRNLSGIIIVDFINLATLAQEEELLQKLRELTKEDPVTVQIVDMTPLGLVEITRRKVFPSLREQMGAYRRRDKKTGADGSI